MNCTRSIPWYIASCHGSPWCGESILVEHVVISVHYLEPPQFHKFIKTLNPLPLRNTLNLCHTPEGVPGEAGCRASPWVSPIRRTEGRALRSFVLHRFEDGLGLWVQDVQRIHGEESDTDPHGRCRQGDPWDPCSK